MQLFVTETIAPCQYLHPIFRQFEETLGLRQGKREVWIHDNAPSTNLQGRVIYTEESRTEMQQIDEAPQRHTVDISESSYRLP
jgi:hypothetical protein